MFMAIRSQKSENKIQYAETDRNDPIRMIARYDSRVSANFRGRDIKMRDHSHGFVIDADGKDVLFL